MFGEHRTESLNMLTLKVLLFQRYKRGKENGNFGQWSQICGKFNTFRQTWKNIKQESTQ